VRIRKRASRGGRGGGGEEEAEVVGLGFVWHSAYLLYLSTCLSIRASGTDCSSNQTAIQKDEEKSVWCHQPSASIILLVIGQFEGARPAWLTKRKNSRSRDAESGLVMQNSAP
jgi:hypothetical protein